MGAVGFVGTFVEFGVKSPSHVETLVLDYIPVLPVNSTAFKYFRVTIIHHPHEYKAILFMTLSGFFNFYINNEINTQ